VEKIKIRFMAISLSKFFDAARSATGEECYYVEIEMSNPRDIMTLNY